MLTANGVQAVHTVARKDMRDNFAQAIGRSVPYLPADVVVRATDTLSLRIANTATTTTTTIVIALNPRTHSRLAWVRHQAQLPSQLPECGLSGSVAPLEVCGSIFRWLPLSTIVASRSECSAAWGAAISRIASVAVEVRARVRVTGRDPAERLDDCCVVALARSPPRCYKMAAWTSRQQQRLHWRLWTC